MASKHPAWGRHVIWAMVRHDGHLVSPSMVLRIMADEDLLLHSDYHKQRREIARQRKAAFAAPPTGPNFAAPPTGAEPGLAGRLLRV